MGAPKPKHVTMKCGWICLDCRAVEFGFDRLGYHLCNGRSVHKKVLSAAYMCQNCPQISDDLAQFNESGCPCSFESKGPEAAAARPAVASSRESSERKHLDIRHRSGRIGGTFMEVQQTRHREGPLTSRSQLKLRSQALLRPCESSSPCPSLAVPVPSPPHA